MGYVQIRHDGSLETHATHAKHAPKENPMARAPKTTPGNALMLLTRAQRIVLSLAIWLSALAGILTFAHANEVLVFVLAGAALAFLAAVVGEATEQVGARLNPGATGILQSTIGN